MENVNKFQSVISWKEAVEKKGFSAGTAICRGLSKTMKEKKMTFPQAYKYLIRNRILILIGKIFAIDVKIFN